MSTKTLGVVTVRWLGKFKSCCCSTSQNNYYHINVILHKHARRALNSWFLPPNTKLKYADAIKCSFPPVNENHQMNTLTAEHMPCIKIEEHELHHRDNINDFDDESSYSPVAKFFIILFMLCISAAILGGIFVLYRRARGAAAGRNVPYRAVFNQGSTARDEHAAVFDGGDDDDGLPSRSPYEI